MFLLRSAFWLTLAFLVLRPGVDVQDAASAVTSEAMARGNQFIVQQIKSIECDTLHCIGGKAMAEAALRPTLPTDTPMHAMSAHSPVPFPRPRPDRAG